MGMSRYYRNIFGVPKDGPPPQKPEAVTVAKIPEVVEMTFVTEEREPDPQACSFNRISVPSMKKKARQKKKK